MTVSELVQLLQTFPPDLPVVYELYSEQCLLEADHIATRELCLPREDRWVQNKRPDMPSQTYLVLPGN